MQRFPARGRVFAVFAGGIGRAWRGEGGASFEEPSTVGDTRRTILQSTWASTSKCVDTLEALDSTL